MNRQEAEKLLAALIFGDLDETSKTDLTAYLQTDDELREQLADMRMAVKVASDALQHGPDPVLGKKRLKHLARLARQRTSSSRRSAVFTVRYMAAAAAILIAVILPSFLIFNRTDNLKRAHDSGGLHSKAYDEAAKVAEADFEFTDDSGSSKLVAGIEFSMWDSDDEATEESLEGKKQFAKATERESIYAYNSVDTIQEHLGQSPFVQSVKFGKGHLALDGDVDEIVDSGDGQVAVDAAVDGDVIAIARGYYYNAPTDAVAVESSSGDIKDNLKFEAGSGGGMGGMGYSGGGYGGSGHGGGYGGSSHGGGLYRLKPDSASGIAGNGATIRTGEKLTETMDSFTVTDEPDRRRSITADSDRPAYTGTPRPARAKTPPGTTRPELLPPPVVAPPRLTESDPKARPDSWVRGMVTNNTEGEEMASIRQQTFGSKNDADGKELNFDLIAKHNAPAGEISGPFGDVRYNAVIVDSLGIDPVFEIAKKGRTYSYEESDVEGVAHDKIYTVREKINRIVLHEEMGGADSFLVDDTYTIPSISNCIISDKKLENADSLLINDTEGGIELAKDMNEPLMGDLPAGGPVFDRDKQIQLAHIDRQKMGERRKKDVDDYMKRAIKSSENQQYEEALGQLNQIMAIDSTDRDARILKQTLENTIKWRKQLEIQKGLDKQEMMMLSKSSAKEIPNSGEDEPDLPPASRFKSVPVNPWVMAERDSLSTFALDVDTASYTLCRRYIHGGFLPPAGAVRMEEFVNYFNYHYPQRADRTFTVHAEAAASPFAGKGKNLTLLKIGVKARTIGRDQRKAAHLILVIDTSASMGKPDRLGLVQQALNMLIDKLSPADRVTLITCSNQARLHLEATSIRQRDKIRQVINAIQPSGSTNLLAGLKLGYAAARRSFDAKGINHVVLCSDGVANVGQTEADAVLKAVAADRKQGITITCVGVGYGSYNDAFLESLANRGDGSYVFLDSARQAKRVFVEQLAATLHTVAKDARIQVSFNPDRVRRYRLIGYENRDIEDKRFRDDTVDAGEVGSGQCSTALYELELTGQPSADQREGLGTVFVRYRRADTGRMEEISHRLKNAIVQRRKVDSSPRFFLAAAAAQFAEIMRQSEHAQHSSLTDVLAVAEKVSLALPLDRDVRELTELIRKAEHLPRSQ